MLTNLYTVLEQNLEEVTLKLAKETHPIFQAHFPNHPILPGFTLIDIMAEIFNDSVVYIKQSKFLLPLLPNDVLRCEVKQNENKKNIKIFKNEIKVSEISYESK